MGLRVLFVVKEIEGAEPIGALYVAGCLEQAGHVCRFVGTRGNDRARGGRALRPARRRVRRDDWTASLLPRPRLRDQRAVPVDYRRSSAARTRRTTRRWCARPASTSSAAAKARTRRSSCATRSRAATMSRHVRDLWVKHDGRIWANPPRELRRDLDAIPFPPRRLLYEYDDSLRQRPLKSFTTNRGCPFPCSYCFNPSLVDHYGSSWKKVRIRSPENVVRRDRRRAEPGAAPGDRLPREHLRVSAPRGCASSASSTGARSGCRTTATCARDLMTDEMVELLAWSGCHTVNLGIETANEKLANDVLSATSRWTSSPPACAG